VVVVIVTWPLYERVLARCGGRRSLASGLTLAGLMLAVFGPLSAVIWVALGEAVNFAQAGSTAIEDDQLVRWAEQGRAYLESQPYVRDAIAYMPVDFDPIKAVSGPVQAGVLKLFNGLGTGVPAMIASAGRWSLDVVIFFFAVVSLYRDGPSVLLALKKLSPINDEYEDHLFGVFAEFANNTVVGSLATGAIQGLVAGIGYAIVGVPSMIFLAILTGVFSFVPLVGTAFVWIPVVLWTAATHGGGWAIFLTIWSIALTGSVDNLLKPLFLRGNSNVHPLLVFIAIFGGMSTFGLAGVLIGPVLVALAISMYRIYVDDFLGEGKPYPEPPIEQRVAEASAEVPPPAEDPTIDPAVSLSEA